MSIEVHSKRKKLNISEKEREENNVIVIDVTKNGPDATFVKFSPFFPHGYIPIPGLSGIFTKTVKGAWQGLKVFENEGVDLSMLNTASPKKRPANEKRGRILGHAISQRAGNSSDEEEEMTIIIGYVEARKQLYVPMYEYVLEHYLKNEIELLRGLVREGNRVILLDYDVNDDIECIKKPLSHASLICSFLKKNRI
jgi:hypothetical protein